MVNAISEDKALNSVAVANREAYILRANNNNPYDCAATEIVEVYGFGKSLTQLQFLTFQSIMNNYFATF
jgi:hypothetical protein